MISFIKALNTSEFEALNVILAYLSKKLLVTSAPDTSGVAIFDSVVKLKSSMPLPFNTTVSARPLNLADFTYTTFPLTENASLLSIDILPCDTFTPFTATLFNFSINSSILFWSPFNVIA